MNSLTIRLATISDLQILSALGITTCYEAYFELEHSEDLAEYCLNFFSLKQLTSEIEDPNSTFFIAESNCQAIGYVKLREGKKIECLGDKQAIEVQRIYLLEKFKGKNFGRALIEKCYEIGKEKGYQILWLGVWDKNISAQRFYERIGMKKIGTTDFSDGKNEFINLVYAKEI